MKQIFNLHENPSVAKSVLVPELERMYKAVSDLPGLLLNPEIKLEELSRITNIPLTELRYQGWEKLFAYIRDLEQSIKKLQKELDHQNKQMRELVIFVEETSQKIVKLYRENSLRNPND